MKKITLSMLFVALCGLAFAQKTDSVKNGALGNNELKLNLPLAIAGVPEINYERIIKDDMSVGVAVLFGLEEDSDYKFGIIPNYRIYFGNKKANGFFIEGNMAVITTQERIDYDYLAYTSYAPGYEPDMSKRFNTATSFGLGAAAGAKFLTKNGFVGELFLGVGRLFGNSYVEAYPRAGITIGKRF
ncbi:hypothetical protein [Pedobacter namyangjuensis]|uniref:hypothetical protein n=1 Tax=Pedobacter namyangjuensis TaxID=600626 RepID=UPI000DE1A948|nr:hypothetical protein [Pedobacter namyangjuensis]